MLPPISTAAPPTAPTTMLVAPRPTTQEPNNGPRNITARAVTASDDTDETQEDSENGRNQRVDGKRQSSSFRRSFGYLGRYLDIWA